MIVNQAKKIKQGERRRIPYRLLLAFLSLAAVCICISQYHLMHKTIQNINENSLHLENPKQKNKHLKSANEMIYDLMTFRNEEESEEIIDKNQAAATTDPIEKLLILTNTDKSTSKELPSHADFINLYGSEIKIDGLETCETFRKNVPEGKRMVGPAGIFNTGTNLMMELLQKNCDIPQKMGQRAVRWQVPWGKHTPASLRLINVAQIQGKGVDQTAVLPAVTIKDPYTWMSSMCRHSYVTNWRHHEDHCPNLIPNNVENKYFPRLKPNEPIPANVRYSRENVGKHKSLVHVWNDWYNEYFDEEKKFPRLVVRFEDLLIYPQEVITKVCDCVGGKIRDPNRFRLIYGTAKYDGGPHKGSNSLIPSIKRYGNATTRENDMRDRNDLDFAKEHLDKNLMEKFNYSYLD